MLYSLEQNKIVHRITIVRPLLVKISCSRIIKIWCSAHIKYNYFCKISLTQWPNWSSSFDISCLQLSFFPFTFRTLVVVHIHFGNIWSSPVNSCSLYFMGFLVFDPRLIRPFLHLIKPIVLHLNVSHLVSTKISKLNTFFFFYFFFFCSFFSLFSPHLIRLILP